MVALPPVLAGFDHRGIRDHRDRLLNCADLHRDVDHQVRPNRERDTRPLGNKTEPLQLPCFELV